MAGTFRIRNGRVVLPAECRACGPVRADGAGQDVQARPSNSAPPTTFLRATDQPSTAASIFDRCRQSRGASSDGGPHTAPMNACRSHALHPAREAAFRHSPAAFRTGHRGTFYTAGRSVLDAARHSTRASHANVTRTGASAARPTGRISNVTAPPGLPRSAPPDAPAGHRPE
jgi:hypothetical protein